MERRQEDGLLNNETLVLLKIRAWQGRGKGLVIWVFKNDTRRMEGGERASFRKIIQKLKINLRKT